MRRRVRTLARAAVLLAAAACVTAPRAREADEAERAWLNAFVEAQQLAHEGRVAGADSALARFADAYPRSREAMETLYWRAIFAVDPANRSRSAADAVALLDRYLAAGSTATHSMEAMSLRRTAQALDSLGRTLTTTRAMADSVSIALKNAATTPEETQKLKDELARTQAELERIRRRLSNPQGRP